MNRAMRRAQAKAQRKGKVRMNQPDDGRIQVSYQELLAQIGALTVELNHVKGQLEMAKHLMQEQAAKLQELTPVDTEPDEEKGNEATA